MLPSSSVHLQLNCSDRAPSSYGQSAKKRCSKVKNTKSCYGSDVVALEAVATWLIGTRTDGDGACRHGGCMKLCYKLKILWGIDGVFAFSSGLCSWIFEDSRICSRRSIVVTANDLWVVKINRIMIWVGLYSTCLQTEGLRDARCSSIRFLKLRCVCPM